MSPGVALTIAGSDSGGGAGLQADLATFAAHRVFGTCAVTAVTAQNTLGVRAIHPVPVDVVVDQVAAVVDDLPVAAVKTGMLATSEIVAAVGELAAAGRLPRLVVDPVMVATSGDDLLDPGAVGRYLECLLPHALVATPNVAEAQALLGRELRTLHDLRAAAEALAARGPRVVVITGGHAVDGDDPADAFDAIDVAIVDGALHELRAPRIATTNDHGTGCALSAALAAGLALGTPPLDALRHANAYVRGALQRAASWRLGAGRGPLDHLAQEQPCPP